MRGITNKLLTNRLLFINVFVVIEKMKKNLFYGSKISANRPTPILRKDTLIKINVSNANFKTI